MEEICYICMWFITGLIGCGFLIPYFEEEFPSASCYREDLGFGIIFSIIGGPIFMIVSYLLSGFGKHGWRLKPKGENNESD